MESVIHTERPQAAGQIPTPASRVPLLWQLISDARHAGAHTFDFWGIAPTDNSDDKRAGYTRFKRSFGGQVKEYAGTSDLPIHAVKYLPAKTFSNTYISIGRSSHY
jgi:lipid II:glycine glycyltransferase (peptidoglycan interpeptide bridge formation enzyme)